MVQRLYIIITERKRTPSSPLRHAHRRTYTHTHTRRIGRSRRQSPRSYSTFLGMPRPPSYLGSLLNKWAWIGAFDWCVRVPISTTHHVYPLPFTPTHSSSPYVCRSAIGLSSVPLPWEELSSSPFASGPPTPRRILCVMHLWTEIRVIRVRVIRAIRKICVIRHWAEIEDMISEKRQIQR